MEKIVFAGASAIGILFLGIAASRATTPVTQRSAPLASISPSLVSAAHAGVVFRKHAARVSPKAPGPLAPPPPLPPPPPTPQEALQDGVLIVVSLSSQQAFVFRKGKVWDSTPVSTGRAGNETPKGVFPILQKKIEHRSTLYDDALMPYMQRLTWDGVALHAGRVPGYPASHGCVRLPSDFAKKLYGITNFSSTIVVVTDKPLASAKEARKLA